MWFKVDTVRNIVRHKHGISKAGLWIIYINICIYIIFVVINTDSINGCWQTTKFDLSTYSVF
jgi:hypothetical protein